MKRSKLGDGTGEVQAKCLDCGETFPASEAGRLVGETYAFCDERCKRSFESGLWA